MFSARFILVGKNRQNVLKSEQIKSILHKSFDKDEYTFVFTEPKNAVKFLSTVSVSKGNKYTTVLSIKTDNLHTKIIKLI